MVVGNTTTTAFGAALVVRTSVEDADHFPYARLAALIKQKLMIAINGPSLVGFESIDTSLGDDAGRLGAAAAIMNGAHHGTVIHIDARLP